MLSAMLSDCVDCAKDVPLYLMSIYASQVILLDLFPDLVNGTWAVCGSVEMM